MKEKETKIKKIVIQVEGKELNLSVESAEKLFNCLKDIYDKTTVIQPTIVKVWPSWPIYYEKPYITYSGGTSIFTSNSGEYQVSDTETLSVGVK